MWISLKHRCHGCNALSAFSPSTSRPALNAVADCGSSPASKIPRSSRRFSLMFDGVRPSATAHHAHLRAHYRYLISLDAPGAKLRDRGARLPGFRLASRFSPPGGRLTGSSALSAHPRYADFSPNFKPQYLRNTRWNQATRGLFFLSAPIRLQFRVAS